MKLILVIIILVIISQTKQTVRELSQDGGTEDLGLKDPKDLGLSARCVNATKDLELELCARDIWIRIDEFKAEKRYDEDIIAYFKDQDLLERRDYKGIAVLCCVIREIKNCVDQSRQLQDHCTTNDFQLFDDYISKVFDFETEDMAKRYRGLTCNDIDLEYCHDPDHYLHSSSSSSSNYYPIYVILCVGICLLVF